MHLVDVMFVRVYVFKKMVYNLEFVSKFWLFFFLSSIVRRPLNHRSRNQRKSGRLLIIQLNWLVISVFCLSLIKIYHFFKRWVTNICVRSFWRRIWFNRHLFSTYLLIFWYQSINYFTDDDYFLQTLNSKFLPIILLVFVLT